jgi:hypothetical protein
MIRTDDGLTQTREALIDLESILASLVRKKETMHPDQFAWMADPVVDHIRRLRGEIEEYIGLPVASAAVEVFESRMRKIEGNGPAPEEGARQLELHPEKVQP